MSTVSIPWVHMCCMGHPCAKCCCWLPHLTCTWYSYAASAVSSLPQSATRRRLTETGKPSVQEHITELRPSVSRAAVWTVALCCITWTLCRKLSWWMLLSPALSAWMHTFQFSTQERTQFFFLLSWSTDFQVVASVSILSNDFINIYHLFLCSLHPLGTPP